MTGRGHCDARIEKMKDTPGFAESTCGDWVKMTVWKEETTVWEEKWLQKTISEEAHEEKPEVEPTTYYGEIEMSRAYGEMERSRDEQEFEIIE